VQIVCEEMIPRAAREPAVETRHSASKRLARQSAPAEKKQTGHAPSLLKSSRLAEFVDVFVERGAFTVDEAEQIFSAAQRHGLGIRAHVCQLSATKEQWLVKMAERFDIASFDHLDCVCDAD